MTIRAIIVAAALVWGLPAQATCEPSGQFELLAALHNADLAKDSNDRLNLAYWIEVAAYWAKFLDEDLKEKASTCAEGEDTRAWFKAKITYTRQIRELGFLRAAFEATK